MCFYLIFVFKFSKFFYFLKVNILEWIRVFLVNNSVCDFFVIIIYVKLENLRMIFFYFWFREDFVFI